MTAARRSPVGGWAAAVPASGVLIAALYLVIGAAYALRTPVWQAPDEPAHFNYVLHIAHGKGLPVLQDGAYDQAYLERLTTGRFREGLPVDRITYEAHQPPLYYALAAPVARVFEGAGVEVTVRVLRAVTLAMGLLLLPLAWAIARALVPDEPALAPAVTGFVGLLPQHLAMLASINNDVLAEVLVAAVLLGSIRLAGNQFPAGMAVAMGAALVTKTTAYAAVALPVLAWVLKQRIALRPLLAAYGIALLAGGLWWLRNASIYGGADIVGLARHAEVVTGQPQVAEWTAGHLRAALTTLFQSFWLQLGWMAAPAAPWVYQGLAVMSGCLAAGTIRAVKGRWSNGLVLCLALLLLVTLQTAVYNLHFLQPQGRYLFPALIPIAVFGALGLRELSGREGYPFAVATILAGLVGLNLYAHIVVLPHL